MIEGIFETHFEVKNLKSSMDFYESLGFSLGLMDDNRKRAFYLLGEKAPCMISIVEREKPALRHMAFRVNLENLHKMIPFLKERNIEILPGWDGASIEEPMVFPWLGSASVFFNDLDGNRLEFITLLLDGPRKDIDQPFLMLSEWEALNKK